MKKIMQYQKEFDKQHGWNWSEAKDEVEKLRFLQYGAVALTGELGEFANNLKKILRENHSLGKRPRAKDYGKLRDELVDIFVYVIILSEILGLDLEAEYYKKMEYNRKRFKRFTKK